MMLVTLQQASDHVRRDSDDDDALLELLVKAASRSVANYLGAQKENVLEYDSEGLPVVDSNDVMDDVPEEVQAATLFLAGWLYRNRDADPDRAFGPGNMPAVVTALLYPLRDPTLA